MKADLQGLFDAAQIQARQLNTTLRAIKSHPEAKTIVIQTVDDDTEILANECDSLLMFLEGIGDWEVQ